LASIQRGRWPDVLARNVSSELTSATLSATVVTRRQLMFFCNTPDESRIDRL
jgi:hypothetical protein